MKILRNQGFALIELNGRTCYCEKLGMRGEEIMFTSNDTPAEEFQKAIELGAILNLDDITHIDFIDKGWACQSLLCLRYNRGHEKRKYHHR
jgi:diaminopimelate decarboxylase